ncbi:MAG: GGDEF domain-containing protein [Oscillospiraceae bacterium]|nr:GGDEF domain-containing protein [Oscillospiraceae bacterium]
MNQYFYTLPVIFMTVLCMLFLTIKNEYVLPAHRKGFFVAFLGAFFVIVCEVATILFDGSAMKVKALHFLANYLGFLLSPLLVVFFAVSIGRFHRVKGAVFGAGAYFVLYNVLVAAKQLFFIDAQNNYHRGNLFFVYLISYLAAVLYLLYETLRFSRKGFKRHRIFAHILSICFLLSSSIQVIKPEVYITRITVVLSLCTYYAYDIELTNLFDRLTGALNQGTYLRKIKELKEQQVVVIFDIDGFKIINDNYGHQYGDNCLAVVARAIKLIFGNYGQAYRIGGDEFAVVLRKGNNVESLIMHFEKTIADKFEDAPCKITVSTGYAKYEKNDTYEDVVKRADDNMYRVKNQKQALAATVFGSEQ